MFRSRSNAINDQKPVQPSTVSAVALSYTYFAPTAPTAIIPGVVVAAVATVPAAPTIVGTTVMAVLTTGGMTADATVYAPFTSVVTPTVSSVYETAADSA
eukprot:m.63708 g.63708  ORF g.63708 m.63708 type:complete len:100 (+) comp9675_c0_seq1:3383-3682(+)